MKRYVTIFLTLIWLTAVSCPVFAAVECTVPKELSGGAAAPNVPMIGNAPADGEGVGQPVNGKYATMGDLYQAWGGYEGYPDYICGVWSTDGGLTNMTVAVTKDEAGEKGKEEILSLLQNPDSVKFTYQSYSYQELSAVNDAIVEQMLAGGSPINSCGIHEMENRVAVTVLETAENAEKVAQELVEQYGNKVFVELGDMIFTDTVMEETGDGGMPGVLLVLIAAGTLVGITLAVKLPARLTSAGEIVGETGLTRRQTEKIIAENSVIPSEQVEEKLMEQVKKSL